MAQAGVVGNPGNRRSGAVKRGRHGQRPWRQDTVVMERIAIGAKLWAERHPESECLRMINAHMASRFPQEPSIGRTTMFEDRKHIRELWAERREHALDEHLATLDHTISEAWKAFHTAKGTSLNRSAYLSTIGGLVEKKAKLDGTMVERKHVTGQGAQMNVLVMIHEALVDLPADVRAMVAARLDAIELPAIEAG